MSNVLTRYAARDAKRRARENNARTAEIQPLIEAALKEKNEHIASLEEALKAAHEEIAALKEKIAAKDAENAPQSDSAEPTTQTPKDEQKAAKGGNKAPQNKGK